MVKHLGGTVLPFVSMGKNSLIDARWDLEFNYEYGKLVIVGDDEWDSSKTSSQCAKAFNADGNWDVTVNLTDKFEAYSKDKKIHVTVIGNSEYDNAIYLTATYDESYDLTKAADSWDDGVQSDMTGLFGEVTDYVYLGLAYPTSEVSNSSTTGYSVQIFGGKWNDSILTDAMSWKAKGFTVSIDVNNNTVVATKKTADGKYFYTYKVDKYGVASLGEKIRLTITKSDVFNPSIASEWTQDIKTCLTTNLNGHENDVPFVYLGTTEPSYSYDDTTKTIKLVGGTWDEAILTNADASYTSSSGWTSTLDKDEETFTATKTFSDCNCVITINISHARPSSTYDYPLMTITIDKGIYIPAGLDDWDAATKTFVAQYFPSLNLPYVYLNLKTSATDTGFKETTAINGGVVSITGGEYIEKIKDNMKASFAADVDAEGNAKWTLTEKQIVPYLSYEHLEADGSIIQVNLTTIQETTDDENETPKTLARIEITTFAAYSVPENGAYDSDLKAEMNKDLHGHEIPYVYLYTSKENYYWYGNLNTLQVWGGKFFKAMIPAAESSFKSKNWETKVSDDGNSLTATFEETDGCEFTVKLYDNEGVPTMEIVYDEPYFDKDNQPKSWNSDTTSYMSSKFKVGTATEEITFPYVYLGTTSESSRYSSNTLTITGQVWSSQIIEDAKATYKAAGWAVYDATYEGKAALIMSKEGEKSGAKTGNNYIVTIYRLNGNPCMKIKNEKTALQSGGKYNPVSTATKWDDSIVNEIKSHNGNYDDIPYIDLGSDSITTDDTNEGFFRLQAGVNFSFMTRKLKAYDQLLAHDNTDGVTNKYNPVITLASSGTNFSVSGKYERTDGSSVYIEIDGNSSKSWLDIYYSAPFDPTAVGNAWSDKIIKTFKKYFDNNVIPYLYLGSSDPIVEVSNDGYEITLTGDTWSDSIYDYAIKAFDEDKDTTTNVSYWGYSYDYSDSIKGKQLVAYKEVATGSYITCKLYKNSTGKPVLECYFVD